MAFEEINFRASILLPSNMNIAEFEEKIFKQQQPVAPVSVKAKTYEDVLYLFGKHQGVVGSMLMNRAGKIIRSNYDGPITGMYCGVSKQILDVLTPTLQSISNSPTQINIIRINSCSQEVVIAPVPGEDLVFVIVQNPEDHPSIAKTTKSSTPVPTGAKESRILRAHMESPSNALQKIDSKMSIAKN